MDGPFHTVFVIGLSALMLLRLYWHWRAGTTRDRAAIRAGLAREGSFARVRWLILPPAAAVLLLYVIAPALLGWSELPLPEPLRWVGAALLAAATCLLVWVHIALGRNFNTTLVVRADHQLVTSGPYRYVRHPMYSAFVLLFSGMFLLSANLLIGLLSVVTLCALLVQRTPREEAQLAERFGEGWHAYRERTGAFWPKWRPGR